MSFLKNYTFPENLTSVLIDKHHYLGLEEDN